MATELKTELRNFGETTTVRGVSRAVKAKTLTVRAVWIIALLICTTMTFYQLGGLLKTYFSYPTVTLLKHSSNFPTFPDVTVCNIFSTADHENTVLTWNEYQALTQAKQANWTLERIQKDISPDISEPGYQRFWEMLFSQEGYFSNLPVIHDDEIETSDEVINQTLLVDCIYYDWDFVVSIDANCSSFIHTVWNTEYFLCYTLHLHDKDRPQIRALEVVLYVNDFFESQMQTYQRSTLPGSMSTGVRVTVHSSGQKPYLKTGINVSPGTDTTINLKQTTVNRLPAPYGSCTTKIYLEEDSNGNPLSKSTPLYSYNACFDICTQSQVINNCKCIIGSMLANEEQQSTYPACGNQSMLLSGSIVSDVEDISGFKHIVCSDSMELNYKICDEECPEPCTNYVYDTSIMSVPWPHRAYQMAFYDLYINGNIKYGTKFNDYAVLKQLQQNKSLTTAEVLSVLDQLNLLSRNFIQLNVVFGDYGTTIISEKEAMTDVTLAANIGGALSLWLGITVMTAVEVAELVWSLVLACHRRRKTSVVMKDIIIGEPHGSQIIVLHNSGYNK